MKKEEEDFTLKNENYAPIELIICLCSSYYRKEETKCRVSFANVLSEKSY